MANLVDTSVNGDLRVTGTMFGTQAGNYATCATAAGTAAKAVTISGFTLTTGIHVFVKFTVTNTAAVASLTLNVSGTGAKAMKYRGGNLPAVGTLSASRVYEFIYDGTNWELVGDLDTNTQTVTGVKGNAESSYRTGQVNLTAANIGASASDHTHGNIGNGGTLTDTAAAAAGNDYVVIRDADNNKVQTSTIKGTDVADAVSKKHSHSTLTLSTTAQAYDGTHTLALPSSDPYTSARTPTSHASSATTYGVGTTANYGHVKLDNSTPLTVGTSSADGVATGKAHIHNALESVARASVTTADLAHINTNTRAHMILSQITSQTSTTHDPGDGYMLSFMWDNTGSYDAQVFIPDAGTSANNYGRLKIRYCNNSAWGDWEYLPLAADCTTLTNSDDLDNIKGSAAGQVIGYKWSTGAVPANAPVSTATSSMLVYQTHSAYCYQVVFTARDGVYRRLCNNGTWEAWSKELVAADIATGTANGTISVAGSDVKVNGWDALSDRVENLEESGDAGFMGNATQDGERLIFEDIIFDSIYPSIGKYGLATFPETATTDATEFSGDRDWLLDWRPYLIDMSPVAGETAKAPIAELRKDNWLRTRDGDYAPVCGITSAQSTALDGKKDTLYWKSGSTGDKVSATAPAAFDSSGKFVPAKFWEFVKANLSTVSTAAGVTYSSPIAVKVYVGTQAYEFGAYTNYHIPAPWETTETKYSVFIGRASDVYVVDGYSATTGEHMRGLCSKPLPVGTNKFDPEDFRLKRTGISPGPSTVVASKIRNFFYNYVVAASSNCTVCGNAGRTSIFYNNGTYPATNGPTQYRCADWSRACNSGGSSGNAVPVGEMGYHALNAFLCSVEAAYGTRNVWEYNRFSEGICANYSASATNGGVLLDGSTWKGWNTTEATLSSTSETYSVAVNGQYAKFQCMEPQIAASLATEMGISAGTSFHWNGGDWHFEVPSNLGTVKTLGGGAMNCRMYKLTDSKTVNGHTVRCNLVCALAEGVNPVGDIWWYVGGGAELVYLTDGTGNTNYKVFFYLEPDQAKWANTSTTEKITSGTFAFESSYTKLLDASTAGGLGNAYCLARTGYTPVRRVSGGAYNTGECTYQYRQIDDDAKGSAGIRSRRRLVFRGIAANTYCSPRYLGAHTRPSNSNVLIGCSAQVLLA